MNRAIVFIIALAVIAGIGALAFFMFDDSSGKSKESIDISSGPAKTAKAPIEEVKTGTITTKDTAAAPKITSKSFVEASGALGDAGVMGIVQSEAGGRVEGAVCELFEDTSALKDRSQEGESRNSQRTTADGLFLFDRNVLSLAERYLLKVSHPMFITERKPVDLRRETGVITVTLRSGIAVSGTVRSVAGAGVPNATVTIFDLTQNTLDPNGSVETFATTDNTGFYTIGHASPGMKKIQASGQGFAAASRQGVNVEAGKPVANMDFTLNEGGTISGQVMSTEGTPVQGAFVTARPVRIGPRPEAAEATQPGAQEIQARREAEVKRREHAVKVEGTSDGAGDDEDPAAQEKMREMKDMIAAKEATVHKERESQRDAAIVRRQVAHQPPAALTTLSVRTQADGTFTIIGTELGSYVVNVSAAGYLAPPPQTVETPSQGANFNVQPNARIIGRVIDDETGKPVAMFSIGTTTNPDEVLVPAYSKKAFGPPKTVDGRFEYVDVRPGKIWLLADAAGYAGGRSTELVIQQGERREGVEIRLVRGSTIKGRVMDARGAGVANATVQPEAASMSGGAANPFLQVIHNSMRREVKEVTTDADGRFALPNMLSGSYTLSVKHRDFGPQTTPTFTVGNSGEVSHPDIVLSRGASISGRVLAPDGQPDGKAMVQVSPVGTTPNFAGHRSAYTGADGRFEVNGLAVGQYRVVVAQRNGTPDLTSLFSQLGQGKTQNIVTLGEGESKEIDL